MNKIINDPVYGFIAMPEENIFRLFEHPYLQRLRRIQQLGLSSLVYPGAVHSRFHHTLGAVHLMREALEVLRQKGVVITPQEADAAMSAICLHDVGHGPFSHALENTLLPFSHEAMSLLMMEQLNRENGGRLEMALSVFKDDYPKRFLHQLVSSQLDMDRLDYLTRDSFFTGVAEGVVGYDRIIKMLQVKADQLVVEEKGIYSIEKFIISRRLMYWQVYLHKTVIAAEQMLVNILKRARALALDGAELFATPSLRFFLRHSFEGPDALQDPSVLTHFAALDDYDVYSAIKVWMEHPDRVLSVLCRCLINRKLFHIEMGNLPFARETVEATEEALRKKHGFTREEAAWFCIADSTSNNAYNAASGQIFMLLKNGTIEDVSKLADHLHITALSAPVVKYYLCSLDEV